MVVFCGIDWAEHHHDAARARAAGCGPVAVAVDGVSGAGA